MFAYEDAVKHFERARLCVESNGDDAAMAAAAPQAADSLSAKRKPSGQLAAGEGHAAARRPDRSQGERRPAPRAAALSIVNPFPASATIDRRAIALLEEALRGTQHRETTSCGPGSWRDSPSRPQNASRIKRRAVSAARRSIWLGARATASSLAHALFTRFWVLMASLLDPRN